MSSVVPLGARGGAARLVADEAYLPLLRTVIAGARRNLLCSIFLVDIAPNRDRKLVVDSVLRDLADVLWRGADVRLLIGGSRENVALAEAADHARARALQLGIPCRWATSTPTRGSHAKFVVADDLVLTGSHNWSSGAFSEQTQDSVLVRSRDLAAYVGGIFERQWAAAS